MTKFGRGRADSVLGNKFDEPKSDFTRMKLNDKRWPQISKLMADKKNKVMLLEVPKGFQLDNDVYGDLFLDLTGQLKKAGKVARSTTKTEVKDMVCYSTATSKE